MAIDFDSIVDRKNTHSMKWDEMESRYGISAEDGIPMWVADMDFRPPQAVNDMLKAQAEHGINGYYGDDDAFKQSIVSWMDRRHGFTVEKDWISTVPGVVAGYSLAIQAFSEPGDGVLVFSPVYHAFGRAVHANNRKLIESQLLIEGGQYKIDFETLPSLVDKKTKILLLCTPHNPGGRVWTREELEQICAFCLERGILIISDEIHEDLVFSGYKHIPTATLSPEIAARTITFSAASKTFNLAGFMTAAAIISDEDIRKRYAAQANACGIGPNRLGSLATTAAYNNGDEWVDAVVEYIEGNEKLLAEGLEAAIPGAKVMRLHSTYLSWVDVSGVDLPFNEVLRRIERDAKVAVNHGATFGKGGETFVRFNLACPRAMVTEAIARIEAAFADLRSQSGTAAAQEQA
ncbi:pyridoxal phosphate-dependent aminotransferase [Rhodobacteraceae bacterium RKSG542]|uniref:MalY/PatB family protein n=1 Tax=Pseudovibrio flavus TaxID=2529854 RepID=UPI0012BC2E22|nr:MalY/PatB family protein [Pseudovibrio flavus]MTI18751.1 pyridoxal phosphate-dependent aminotransferase [Pseudovibrio flavus]